ncbi:MAG: chorismate-binding protein [Candidatus Gracilibacteria bacterium]|nr:chorismate-binding protein [Candidatus Gracilibacteria bacterium]
MVIDEELKMMSKITKSGNIEVPLLKEVGAVIHTEANLNGMIKDNISILDAFKETIFAPTLVGGPIESAFKNIKKYENDSRGYYGGAFGILGEDFLDSCIVIRTAFINKLNSILEVRAGAGIVKDSLPEKETQETIHKSNGFFGSLLGKASPNSKNYLSSLDNDELINLNELLENRKKQLSNFYLNSHLNENLEVEEIKDKNFVLVNNGDDFVYLTGFMIERMGGNVKIVNNGNFEFNKINASDIVLLGPGYGDINDENDYKMIKLLDITDRLISNNNKIIGICLGHQAICKTKGYQIEKQDKITQGEQLEVLINGKYEKLGFYNSFSPVNNGTNNNIEIFLNNRILNYKDSHISSTQAHPESIMSINGFELLKNMILEIL